MSDNIPNALPSYLASVARFAGGAAATYLVNHGLADKSQEATIVGCALGLVTLGWALIQKRNAHKALTAAIIAPAGKAVP